MAFGPHNGQVLYATVSVAGANTALIYQGQVQLCSFTGFNTNGSPRYVKFFDASVISQTSGMFGTTAKAMFGLPGNSSGAGSNIPFAPSTDPTGGLEFKTGLAVMMSSNMNLSGSDISGVGAGDVLITVGYRY